MPNILHHRQQQSPMQSYMPLRNIQLKRDHEKIQQNIQSTIQNANTRVSTSEQIKNFGILEDSFSIDNDEITLTGKLKRNVVIDHYKKTLEMMYN